MRTRQSQTDIEQFIDSNLSAQETHLFSIRKVRKTSSEQLDQALIKKISALLTCPLCNNILNDPVYLSCSHRFCRTCMQYYLKEKMKKYCPACNVQKPITATRKDIRSDFSTSIMLTAMDGILCQLDQVLPIEENNSCLKRLKGVNLNQPQQQLNPMKRFKRNTLEMIELKRDDDSQNTSLNAITDLNTSKIRSFHCNSSAQSSNSLVIGSENTRNNNISSSFSSFSASGDSYFTKDPSLSETSLSLNQSNEVIINDEKQQKREDFIKKAYEHFSIRMQNNAYNNPNISLEHMSLDWDCSRDTTNFVKIKLKQCPDNLLTPPLDFTQILLPGSQSTNIIVSAIAENLNLTERNVKLFYCCPKTKRCIFIKKSTPLGDLFSGGKRRFSREEDLNELLNIFDGDWLNSNEEKCSGVVYYRVIV